MPLTPKPICVRTHQKLRPLPLALAASMLAGCAVNPVVTWQRPSTEQTLVKRGMGYAFAYADNARDGYKAELVAQLKSSADLSNALIGGGALIAALAFGKAHRDAIVGPSLLAGTAYAIGNQNLNRARQLLLQAGIEGFNCAKRAVLPFSLTADESDRLDIGLASLARALVNARKAMGTVKVELDKVPAELTSTQGKEATAAVEEAKLAITAAEATDSAGRSLAGAARRAGDELVLAIDRIDAAVIRATLEALPDLSAVPKVIAGLAGMAGQFAPGAGVEQVLGDALSKSITAGAKAASEVVNGTPNSASLGSPLVLATRALHEATQALAIAAGAVNSHLNGRSTVFDATAFKDCGVAIVVTPLVVNPTSMNFTLGAAHRRTLDISGGVAPYSVEIDGSQVKGVTLRPIIRNNTNTDISVAADADAGSTTLRITDSSSPVRVLPLIVTTVAPAAAASAPAKPATTVAAAGNPGAAANSAPAAPTSVAESRRRLDQRLDDGSFRFAGQTWGSKTAVSVDQTAGRWLVSLTCSPGKAFSPSKPSFAQVGRALLNEVNADASIELVNLKSDPKCLTK